MNKVTRIAMPLFAAALIAGTSFSVQAQQAASNDQAQYNGAFVGTPEQEQAYKDGIEAAKLDAAAKRTIDPTASHLYKNPPARVKKEARNSYRDAFTQGYKKQAADQSKATGTGL